jgi:diguanylate cyclase (GGDEF)-like protein
VLRRELKRADRYKTDLSLVISDIDHFKSINDTYGHQFGDEVLKSIAGILEKESRKDVDIPARYGGEEFGIILGNTNIDEAREITDRIRTHIAQQVFHTTQSQPVSVTMSFGLAGYRVHATRPDDIVKKADKALYVAKRSGRNRVEVF